MMEGGHEDWGHMLTERSAAGKRKMQELCDKANASKRYTAADMRDAFVAGHESGWHEYMVGCRWSKWAAEAEALRRWPEEDSHDK